MFDSNSEGHEVPLSSMTPDSNCFVMLVLQNSASHPVYLKEGQLLEVVQEVAEKIRARALRAVGSNSESIQDVDCLKLKDLAIN